MKSRGFTILEVTVSITVLAVIAAVLAPTISGVADAYAATQRVGRATDGAAFAMDRLVRAIREIPERDSSTELAIAECGEGVLRLSDVWEVRLVGGDLVETPAGGEPSLLCSGVDRLVIEPLAADGRTVTDAATAHVLRVGLIAGVFEILSIGMPRLMMTP